MTQNPIDRLKEQYRGGYTPPEDLKMYENELNIEIEEIEVVKDVSERVYDKISGSELEKLINRPD